MAPTITPRIPSGDHVRHLARTVASGFSLLGARSAASSGESVCSVFALVLTSSSTLSRRALTSIHALSTGYNDAAGLASRSVGVPFSELDRAAVPALVKRQNAILVIPATYAGLNAGPKPGTIVGIMLGAIAGFILCLYILLLSLQFYGGRETKIIEEEVIVKRKSRSRSKSHRSSHHSQVVSEHISVHQSPSPPQRSSRRETIVEIVEEVRRPSRHHSPSPEPEEVIVEEEESLTEEIVEVIEEQTQSSIVSPSPPPRNQSQSRRSGFRVVDPAEFGGGDAPMRRINSRRSSGRG